DADLLEAAPAVPVHLSEQADAIGQLVESPDHDRLREIELRRARGVLVGDAQNPLQPRDVDRALEVVRDAPAPGHAEASAIEWLQERPQREAHGGVRAEDRPASVSLRLGTAGRGDVRESIPEQGARILD